MKPYAKTLQRLLNAMAYANAGNLREFEELLEASDQRRLVDKRSTARHYGTAARHSRRHAIGALPLPQL
jgi:hypothetical protein